MKNAFIFRQRRATLLSILLGMFLLASQFGALIHAVDHPFHTPNKSCQIFSDMEHAGNGMVSCDAHLTTPRFSTPEPSIFHAPSPLQRPSIYATRAPPVTS